MTQIFTNSGKMFDLLNPNPGDVDIARDVSSVLGRIVRFNGHCGHYTVAEHCWIASQLVDPCHAIFALLHDAQEAYVGDIATPAKQAIGYASVEQVEAGIHRAICEHVGVSGAIPPEVFDVDEMLFHFEALSLFEHNPPWVNMGLVDQCAELMSDRGIAIERWDASTASQKFHRRLLELVSVPSVVEI